MNWCCVLTHQSIKTVSFNLSCNPAQEYASSCLFINLFMANIPISYALEYQTTKVFLVFTGYKIETLVRNELVYYIHLRKSIDQINILVQVYLPSFLRTTFQFIQVKHKMLKCLQPTTLESLWGLQNLNKIFFFWFLSVIPHKN